MPRVNCTFCGLPFSVRVVADGTQHFCCSGCALASRIPVNGDVLPVSRGLVIALALGFGLFNEILFTVLGAAIVAQGRVEIGLRMVGIGLAMGTALFVVSFAFLITARSRRWTDGVAGTIAVALAGWSAARIGQQGLMGAAWPLLWANGWLAAWWSRGWLRRSVARRRHQA